MAPQLLHDPLQISKALLEIRHKLDFMQDSAVQPKLHVLHDTGRTCDRTGCLVGRDKLHARLITLRSHTERADLRAKLATLMNVTLINVALAAWTGLTLIATQHLIILIARIDF